MAKQKIRIPYPIKKYVVVSNKLNPFLSIKIITEWSGYFNNIFNDLVIWKQNLSKTAIEIIM